MSGMSVYKVFDVTRTKRKLVIANDLKDLITKAARKLCLADGRIVLEADGTDVEEDEELAAFKTSTLMFLQESESWASPSESGAVESTQADKTPFTPNIQQDAISQKEVDSSSVSSCPSTPERSKVESTLKRGFVGPSTPIPPLSDFVKRKLDEKAVHAVWKQLINECAQYYIACYPNLSEKGEYRQIGQKMYETYPAISHDGTEKWTHFITCLSQRIRHIRWSNKRKSSEANQVNNGDFQSPKRARFSKPTNHTEISEEDYKKHLQEIQNEWSKPKPSRSHIHVLLRNTFYNRRSWISTLPNGQIREVWEKFPCFGEGEHVFSEFLNRLACGEDCLKFVERLQDLATKIIEIMPSKPQGTDTECFIEMWKWMEEQTGYKKGKGKKTQSVLVVKKDIPSENVNKETESGDATAPKLVIFISEEGNFEEAVVVGDGIRVMTHSSNISEAVICLVAVYYVADLNYPNIYSAILGLIQEFVIKDHFTEEKSANCKIFLKKHENIFLKD